MQVLGNYCFYDFNYPESVPADLHHAFAVVVADPPYLAAECLQKTCETMRLLAASPSTTHHLLTGSTMRDIAYQELKLRWPSRNGTCLQQQAGPALWPKTHNSPPCAGRCASDQSTRTSWAMSSFCTAALGQMRSPLAAGTQSWILPSSSKRLHDCSLSPQGS